MRSSFKTVSFDDVVEDVSAGNGKVPQSTYLETGAIPVVDQGQRLVAGYTDDLTKGYKGELPVIVFGDHTKCFKYLDVRSPEEPMVCGY